MNLSRPSRCAAGPPFRLERLVKRPILHDHAQGVAVLQDRDVGERVAVHQQQVRQRAGLDHAVLTGQAHELAAQARGRDDRVHRREAEDLDEDPEIARVRAVRRVGEAVVAAGQHADPALAHAVHGLDGHRELALERRRALGGHAPLAGGLAQVVGDAERGPDEDAIAGRLERVEHALVDPVRVVDDVDPVAQRDHHGLRAAAVRRHAQPRRARDLHGRRDLGVAHRRLVGGIARRAGIPGEVELQQVDALARQQPAHAADLLGTVGDPAERRGLVVRQVQHVRVAEAAGDGDLWAVGEKARPGHAAGLDLTLQHDVEPRLRRRRGEGARVAAVEHQLRVAHRDEHVLLGRQARQLLGRHVGEAEVRVRLDEAGHQRRPAGVDEGRAAGRRRRAGRDLGDPVGFDAHGAGEGRLAGAVEDPGVGDQVRAHSGAELTMATRADFCYRPVTLVPGRRTTMSLDRRTFLKRTGAAGAAAFIASRLPAPGAASAQDMTVRPDPAAKRGGTLRYAVHNAPAHFDVHQSGTVANIGPQSPMYDTLLRRSPKDGQTIIPDLAWKWEISPDGKKYTFHLRKGVKFHDGADFTAEDVKATYDRIAHPPKGVVIPRTPLFSTVGDIVVVDPHKIEFRLTEARPKAFMLGAFASGWNIIWRQKTLEDKQGNLRQVMNYPGTGPFRHVSRKDKEVWIMERNPNYWNKGLPYVDKLEVYHMMPFSPELGSSFLSGKVDYARLLEPVSWRKAREMQGVMAAAFNQSVIQAVWVNNKKALLGDPRVRRAMHLALDRHALVDVVRDVAPMLVGGFVYPFRELSTPAAELVSKRLGYQKDTKAAVQEAKRLMAEAGHAGGIKNLTFLVRDAATFKLWSVAIQAMLKETLHIETNLRTVQISQWFDEAQAGNFDLAISAIVSTLMDPSDIFSAWYGKDGPQNYSRWTNPVFHDIANQVERELDDNKRRMLVRKAEDILENDPPLIPVSYEQIYDAWYNKVHGQNPSTYFGIYDVVRWDNVWLA